MPIIPKIEKQPIRYMTLYVAIMEPWEAFTGLRFNDTLPSPLLDPSWAQVSQTTDFFGFGGTLPTLSTKRGRRAC